MMSRGTAAPSGPAWGSVTSPGPAWEKPVGPPPQEAYDRAHRERFEATWSAGVVRKAGDVVGTGRSPVITPRSGGQDQTPRSQGRSADLPSVPTAAAKQGPAFPGTEPLEASGRHPTTAPRRRGAGEATPPRSTSPRTPASDASPPPARARTPTLRQRAESSRSPR